MQALSASSRWMTLDQLAGRNMAATLDHRCHAKLPATGRRCSAARATAPPAHPTCGGEIRQRLPHLAHTVSIQASRLGVALNPAYRRHEVPGKTD